jgi:hypothetical protein
MTSLGTRTSSLQDSKDTDTDKKETDTEEKKYAQSLHDRDSDRHDEREWNGHEKQIGDDVTGFICVYPGVTNDTEMISCRSILGKM